MVSGSLNAAWSLFTNSDRDIGIDVGAVSNTTQYPLISRDVMVKAGSVMSIVYSFSYFFCSWCPHTCGQSRYS